MNYRKIEEELRTLRCPVCDLPLTEISISANLFTMEVDCTHKEFLKLIETEYNRLKKEQLDIN